MCRVKGLVLWGCWLVLLIGDALFAATGRLELSGHSSSPEKGKPDQCQSGIFEFGCRIQMRLSSQVCACGFGFQVALPLPTLCFRAKCPTSCRKLKFQCWAHAVDP